MFVLQDLHPWGLSGLQLPGAGFPPHREKKLESEANTRANKDSFQDKLIPSRFLKSCKPELLITHTLLPGPVETQALSVLRT